MAEWDREAALERAQPSPHAAARRLIRQEIAQWKITQNQIAARAAVKPSALSSWMSSRVKCTDTWVARVVAATKELALEVARRRLAERDPEFAAWDAARLQRDAAITVRDGENPVAELVG